MPLDFFLGAFELLTEPGDDLADIILETRSREADQRALYVVPGFERLVLPGIAPRMGIRARIAAASPRPI